MKKKVQISIDIALFHAKILVFAKLGMQLLITGVDAGDAGDAGCWRQLLPPFMMMIPQMHHFYKICNYSRAETNQGRKLLVTY